MFNRTGLSNPLNKIQFTFEVVPCLILGFLMIFSKVCINFSPALQGGGWVGGRRGVVGGWGVEREEAKAPQVRTQGDQLPTDGSDDATRLKEHHSCQE